MSFADLTMAEAQAVCDRMNTRKGRSPAVGMITLQIVQDALAGKKLAHHPVTSEILGEVTYQIGQRPPQKAPRKTKPKKQPRKK